MQRTVRVLALAGGLCALLTGLLAGLGGLAVALLSGEEARTLLVLLLGSMSALGIALGGALAWEGWQSLQDRPSQPWLPRRTWIALLLLAGAIAAGAWAAGTPPLDVFLLPAAHILATALPPAILVALIARRLGGHALRRHVVAQAGSGAFLSTFLAMLAETLLLLGLVVVAAAVVTLLPGGQAWLEQLAQAFESAAAAQDPGRLLELARSPWLWAAALAITAVAIPLIEESVKTLGVALMLYRRPARDEAFLWGAASGAGFAMAESALNSLIGLPSWATAVLLRIPAGLMHTFTGALMGLAWHAAFVERRRGRALALFLLSVTIHAAWNALAIGSGILSIGEPSAGLVPTGGPRGASLLEALLLAMAAGVAVALELVTRKLRPAPPAFEASPRTPPRTPPAPSTAPESAEPDAAEPPEPAPDPSPPTAGPP